MSRSEVVAAIVGAIIPLVVTKWWTSSDNWLTRFLSRPKPPDDRDAREVSARFVSSERLADDLWSYEVDVINASRRTVRDVSITIEWPAGASPKSKDLKTNSVSKRKSARLTGEINGQTGVDLASPPNIVLAFVNDQGPWRVSIEGTEYCPTDQDKANRTTLVKKVRNRRIGAGVVALILACALVAWLLWPERPWHSEPPKPVTYTVSPTPGLLVAPFSNFSGVTIESLGDLDPPTAYARGLIAPSFANRRISPESRAPTLNFVGDTVEVICRSGGDEFMEAVQIDGFADEVEWMLIEDVSGDILISNLPECDN